MKRYGLVFLTVLGAAAFLTLSCGGGGGGGGGGGSSLFTEPAYFVSVSDPAASDANPGTRDEPFATIQAAIDAAAAAHATANVYVAAGTYQVDSGTPAFDSITLKEGISVRGGYAADWSARDIVTHVTSIEDVAATAGTDQQNYPVTAEAGVTAGTLFEGFAVTGADDVPTSVGVFLDTASPTLRSNTISSGMGSYDAYGVYLTDSSSTLSGNTIAAAGSSDEVSGIYVTGNSSATITSNTISGGTAPGSSHGILNDSDNTVMRHNTVTGSLGSGWAYAIYNWARSNLVVEDNTLDAGAGSTISVGLYNYQTPSYTVRGNLIDGGDANNSIGILNYQTGTLTIVQNRIFGGTTAFSTGISERHGSANLIRNNIIHGGTGVVSYGVYVEDSFPALENNTIYGGSAGGTSAGVHIVYTGYGASSEPDVNNNIITANTGAGSSICVSEQAVEADPNTLYNNALSGCVTPYFDMDDGCPGNGDGDNNAKTCTFAEMQALVDISQGGNVSADPGFEDADGADNDLDTLADNLWNLTASSPVSVTEGGMDLSADFTEDFAGATRTAPWSMGAYEY